jgi:hypothetical protein
MPRPGLRRHIARMRGGSGGQFGVQLHLWQGLRGARTVFTASRMRA